MGWRGELERATGLPVRKHRPLGGGCVAAVHRAWLGDGRSVVAKVADSGLAIEAWMLRYLGEHSALPVPAVVHASDSLLVLAYVEHGGRGGADEDAADHLARLHDITTDRFGLERDTVIGGLPQPNRRSRSWIEFFAERRLLAMGARALESGRLPAGAYAGLERVAARLSEWIDEPAHASLVHGDVWTGNVLTDSGRVRAFIDPAIYYADPEIELAFVTLFSTFGPRFFDRYREHRGLAAGFFEVRRDLYNLYPLLVHTGWFGGGYAAEVERGVRRLVG